MFPSSVAIYACVIVSLLIPLFAIPIMIVIFKYIRGKPPGRQTSLDGICCDCIVILIIFTILNTYIVGICIMFGPVSKAWATVVAKSYYALGICHYLSIAMFSIQRGLLIYETGFMSNFGDFEIQLASRVAIAIMTTLIWIIDYEHTGRAASGFNIMINRLFGYDK